MENFTICDNLDLCLSQLDRNSKIAVAISREHAQNSHQNSFSRLYCFKNFEIIHEYALKFLLHKDFPLQSELNRFIQTASASGLIEKWRSISRIRSKRRNVVVFYGIIRLETYFGIFLLLIAIFIFLILSLIFEKIVNKKARKQNSFRFWLLIERFIEPHRHFWCENVLFWK